ncbi:hypothetical protein NXS19_002160 [Fusarium pseudograminearum]|nr:hypothetical protein NXS19_002160 [Fusarium pseudograminearum]
MDHSHSHSMDPERATSSSSTPRKFSIRSNFGKARQPRSRKNRPCDACRRRKTACVITSEPPCLFCKSRGLVCQSLSDPDVLGSRPGPSSASGHHIYPGPGGPSPSTADTARSLDATSPASITASVTASVTASNSAISPSAASEVNRHHRSEPSAVVHNGLVRPHPPSVPGQSPSALNTLSLDPPRLQPNQEVVFTPLKMYQAGQPMPWH